MAPGEVCPCDREDNWVPKKLTKRKLVFCFLLFLPYTGKVLGATLQRWGLFSSLVMGTPCLTKERATEVWRAKIRS